MATTREPAVEELGFTLEELAQIACDGAVDEALRDRLMDTLRTDPRLASQFAELDALAADAGAEDPWEGLRNHWELDRLLAAAPWDDPAEVLDPGGRGLASINFRQLIAIARARAARAEDPSPILAVERRLLRAEAELAKKAAFQVAEALSQLSATAAVTVLSAALSDLTPPGE